MRAFIRQMLKPFPRAKALLRRVAGRFANSTSVSSHYRPIKGEQVLNEAARLRSSWQDLDLPSRQRQFVDGQLAKYREGGAIDVFDVFVRALEATGLDQGTVLEVGCSSGFYSEVVRIKSLPFTYSGCDYSPAFIDLARERHPDVPFTVDDATKLHHADERFDIVVSGCCLLHIPEFQKAIAETARVARQWAVFHRTPVVKGLPDQYYRKQAYGIETIEIHFNEEQLLELFARHGLETIQVFTLDESRVAGHEGTWRYTRTYVCKKVTHA